MTEQAAVDVLCRDNKHCSRLKEAIRGPGPIKVEDMGYEDVFYPLRCHHRDGLRLEVTTPDGETTRYLWGSGDLIYRSDDDVRRFETAVDTVWLWSFVAQDHTDLTVTIADHADQEADDDD